MKELGEIKRTADYLDYTDKYIGELFHQYLPDDPLWVYKYAYSLRRAAQMMRNHTDLNTLADAYESLSVSFADKASDKGVNITQKGDIQGKYLHTPIRYDQFSLYSASGALFSRMRAKGTTGLLTGHFRLFTPSSLAHVAYAASLVDNLYLGIETNERSLVHKNKHPVLSDNEIVHIARMLTDNPFLINEEEMDYTDLDYLDLVRVLTPDFYFGQSGNSPNRRSILARRAVLAGSEYVELPEVPGFHTTELLLINANTRFMF